VYKRQLWNINPELSEIREHAAPHGSGVGLNAAGKPGYRGPCPDTGTHRYLFRLFALDIKLKLPDGATRQELERAMEQHILATAELGASYQRSNAAPI
jgi:Raf kinase inhibitor-like YbhB/YbcL family protein